MALQIYTLVSCYIDGSGLLEEGSITIDVSSNAQPVNTVGKGFAGMSPGAATVAVSIDSAIPAAGFEFNPGDYTRTLKIVEFTAFAAGKTMTTKGFLTDYSLTHAVNSESKLSMKLMCEPASFA